jgi:DNA-binding CsgD family transcriptional regulator
LFRWTIAAIRREDPAATSLVAVGHEASQAATIVDGGGNPDVDAVSSAADVRFSRREGEVIALLATGLTDPEIAARLGLSVATVKTLLQRAYRKLQVGGRAEAAAQAARHHLIG